MALSKAPIIPALNGGEVVAKTLIEVAGGIRSLNKPAGLNQDVVAPCNGELRNAILFGYFMRRGRSDMGIPDWYAEATQPRSPRGPEDASIRVPRTGVEILEGDEKGLSDVCAFLDILQGIRAHGGGIDGTRMVEGMSLLEIEAASGLCFDWDAPIYVTRAPGRLDVMGGIASTYRLFGPIPHSAP